MPPAPPLLNLDTSCVSSASSAHWRQRGPLDVQSARVVVAAANSGCRGARMLLMSLVVLLVATVDAAPTADAFHLHHNFEFVRSQLEKFGYLRNTAPTLHEFRAALKLFQDVLGVEPSGEIDEATVLAARRPRCSQQDVHRPASARKKRFTLALQSKWDKKHFTGENELLLKWFISTYTSDIDRPSIRATVRKAFQLWSAQSNIRTQKKVTLRFEEAASQADSDINILWAEGEHGDAHKFGKSEDKEIVLAHTFFPSYASPLNGDIHFDDAEEWGVEVTAVDSGKRFFPYVLAHEIGHALGLHHSRKQEALMYPYYKSIPLDEIVFDIDDKCGMNWNYVGSSHFCLFVWLMSEIVPMQRALDDYSHMRNTNHRSPAKRLLKNMKIPRCTPSNNELQKVTEKKLMKNLHFNADEARKYTEVVCNFLTGLHVYRAGANYSPDEAIDKEFAGVNHEVSSFSAATAVRRMLRHADQLRHDGQLSVFDARYFDEAFFDGFFTAFLPS
ncbi:unnamed protein product [Caenorhabditis auriculariae]|uniref:Peptidase metallopeptidase domain-containing protein n=1 Tax=Caenorhabditis auriculariae TaxID=2777116 RepID=A0A8S1GXW4_9PELO|nr:unnamed protein product [Caenorhabditis auriculariae]